MAQQWEWEIDNKTSWLSIRFKELLPFKDLLFRLVRKDFLSSYQQTILGPFWVIFQPLVTVVTYVIVFDKVLGISTQGVPTFLYYLAGITLWNLFSDLLINVSSTFGQNLSIFSKVYFPRIIAPLSILLVILIKFAIQLSFLLVVLAYYYFSGRLIFNPLKFFLFIPVIVTCIGFGFGAGLIFSVITVKYRDVLGLLQTIMRVLMFVCPIFYSLSMVPHNLVWFVNINPLSVQFELFRYSLFGEGQVSLIQIAYSNIFMLVLLFSGIALFNKMGDRLIDIG